MKTVVAFVILAVSAALFGCEDAQALKATETKQKLVGTWLREMEIDGAKGRRVLSLAGDGTFTELLRVEFPGGRKSRSERSGEWAFDGTNLKRRYTHEDQQQLSGNFHFVTFAVTSLSNTQFEGKNFTSGEEIRYRRLREGETRDGEL
jgi:hypothetical protein